MPGDDRRHGPVNVEVVPFDECTHRRGQDDGIRFLGEASASGRVVVGIKRVEGLDAPQKKDKQTG